MGQSQLIPHVRCQPCEGKNDSFGQICNNDWLAQTVYKNQFYPNSEDEQSKAETLLKYKCKGMCSGHAMATIPTPSLHSHE